MIKKLNAVFLVVSATVTLFSFSSAYAQEINCPNCTPEQIGILQKVMTNAANSVHQATFDLLNCPSSSRASGQRYTSWFGTYDPARYQAVVTKFAQMSEKLRSTKFDFVLENYCAGNLLATWGGDNKIYLCPQFWDYPDAGRIVPVTKTATIIHEVAHGFDPNSSEETYYKDDCLNLASMYPDKAIQNADNYAWFANNDPALNITGMIGSPYIAYSFSNNLNENYDGGGRFLTAVGGSFTTGKSNNASCAYQFSGSSEEYLRFGPMNNFSPVAGSVTLSGWFKTASTQTSPMMLFGFGQAARKCNFQVGVYNNVFRVNGWGDENDWRTGINPVPYFNNQWHHVSVTHNRQTTTTKFYIDGVLKASTQAYTYNIDANNAYVVIGNEIDLSGWHFNGVIDDFSAFNHELSSTDVYGLYTQTKPYSEGLHTYYPCNNDLNDYSLFRNNLVNNATKTTDRFGNLNYAMGLNGVSMDCHTNKFISFAYSDIWGPKTISAWFKSSNQTGKTMMIGGFGTAYPQYNFQVGIYSNFFRVNGWGIDYDWQPNVYALPYLDGQWHHCVVTYDGVGLNFITKGATKLYLDGVLVCTTYDYIFQVFHLEAKIVIGREIDLAGWEWDGALDEIRFYGRALTDAEVTGLYNYEKLSN